MKRIAHYGYRNIVYQRLKASRKEQKLSQSDLAARLQTYNINIDQQAISKIERNNRVVTDYELVCLCRALNVDPEWLLMDYDKLIKRIPPANG